jgi:hypothetical protein
MFDIEEMAAQVDNDLKALKTPPKEEVEAKEEVAEPKPEPKEAEDEKASDEVDGDAEEKPETEEAPKEEKEVKTSKAPQRITNKLRAEQAERRAREAEIALAKLQGATEATKKAEAKTEKVDDVEPDASIDPIGHANWKIRQLENKLKEDEKFKEQLIKEQTFTKAEKLWNDTDSALAESNPTYATAKKFLKETVTKQLKEAYPDASASDIAQVMRSAEYELVSKLARVSESPSFIANGFIAEAMNMGFNPAQSAPKPVITDTRPKTDPREVAAHKRNAGTVATVPQGGGANKMTATDLANMSTTNDLYALANLKDSDWKALAAEAAKG